MPIKLMNVRLSFPAIFQKAIFDGVETKFEATLLLDKVKHAAVILQINAAIKAKIDEELKGARVPPEKLFIKDGDDSPYDGYAGCFSVKASNRQRPLVIDRDKTPLVESDGRPYAGCMVNAIIDPWAQNNNYGKRINANLLGIQFVGDGEPFGSGNHTSSLNDFDAMDEVPTGVSDNSDLIF